MTESNKFPPKGFWPAEITPQIAAKGGRRYSDLASKGMFLFWAESLPEEKGRTTIMRLQFDEKGKPLTDEPTQLTPAPLNVASKLGTGYGGGSFCVGASAREVYYISKDDGQLYLKQDEQAPVQITDQAPNHFGDLCFDEHNKQIICVMETPAETHEAGVFETHELVAIDLKPGNIGTVKILATGKDFYGSPSVSSNGKYLAFLAWDLPHMPWEAAAIYEISLKRFRKIPKADLVYGGPGKPTFQPTYGLGGLLYFIAEWEDVGTLFWRNKQGQCQSVFEQISFGDDPSKISGPVLFAFCVSKTVDCLRPRWISGQKAFVQKLDGEFIVTGNIGGFSDGFRVEVGNPCLFKGEHMPFFAEKQVETPVILGNFIASLASNGAQSSSPTVHVQAVGNLYSKGDVKNYRRAVPFLNFDPPEHKIANLELGPEQKSFGDEENQIYYMQSSPFHEDYDEKYVHDTPNPLIINLHGGPTGMADRDFQIKKQFWCNRGFTYLDLDYSGSAGYGAAYCNRLNGRWGQIDAEETIALAKHVSQQNKDQDNFIFLTGGSAGAYTALRALMLQREHLFTGALLNYPVTDLYNLTKVTHKFEAGYLYTLTGTNKDNAKEILGAQSPLKALAKIKDTPLFIAQGTDDKVVPKGETDAFVGALQEAGGQVTYLPLEGEGHGFRQQKSVEALLTAQLIFVQNLLIASNHPAYQNLK